MTDTTLNIANLSTERTIRYPHDVEKTLIVTKLTSISDSFTDIVQKFSDLLLMRLKSNYVYSDKLSAN